MSKEQERLDEVKKRVMETRRDLVRGVENPEQAAQQVSQMLDILANPQQITGVEHYTHMDHVWIYMDEIEEHPAETEQ